jgi:hypothetical protein
MINISINSRTEQVYTGACSQASLKASCNQSAEWEEFGSPMLLLLLLLCYSKQVNISSVNVHTQDCISCPYPQQTAPS